MTWSQIRVRVQQASLTALDSVRAPNLNALAVIVMLPESFKKWRVVVSFFSTEGDEGSAYQPTHHSKLLHSFFSRRFTAPHIHPTESNPSTSFPCPCKRLHFLTLRYGCVTVDIVSHARAIRSYILLIVNCTQLSSIEFAGSQLNALSIVFLFKPLFTPKVGIEVSLCSIT